MARVPVALLAIVLLDGSPLLAGGFEAGQRSRSFEGVRRESVIDGNRDLRTFQETRVAWEGTGRSEQAINDVLIDLRGVFSQGSFSDGAAQLSEGFRDPLMRLRSEGATSSSEFSTSGSELSRVRSQVLERYRSFDRLDETGEQTGSFVSSF